MDPARIENGSRADQWIVQAWFLKHFELYIYVYMLACLALQLGVFCSSGSSNELLMELSSGSLI